MNPTVVPATEALLAGYAGPCDWLDTYPYPDRAVWCPSVYGPVGMANGAPVNRVRLPLTKPGALDHALRHLAAGVKCPMRVGQRCGENIAACEWVAYGEPSSPLRVIPAQCPRCHGTGYLRQPAPAWHLRDTASGGTLTAQVAAEAVAWSVVSVERGGGVLRGVAVFLPEDPWMRYRERGDICARDGMGKPRGFGVVPVRPTQDCYDAVLLERNYGTLNPDGLTLPALPVEKP
jgi:hypothetical protein